VEGDEHQSPWRRKRYLQLRQRELHESCGSRPRANQISTKSSDFTDGRFQQRHNTTHPSPRQIAAIVLASRQKSGRNRPVEAAD